MITPAQCRAARGLLDMSQADLSARCGLSVMAISAFEKGGAMRDSNKAKVTAALQNAGVIMLASGESADGGSGVRFSAP